jgi:hypothetical protein
VCSAHFLLTIVWSLFGLRTVQKAPCQKKKIQGVEDINKRWSSVPSKVISSDIKVACGEPLGDDSVLVHIQGILQASKTAKRKSFQHNVVLKSFNGRFMIQTEIFLLETPDDVCTFIHNLLIHLCPFKFFICDISLNVPLVVDEG